MRRRKHETEKHESEKAETLQKSFFSDDELSEFQTWIQCLSLDNLLKELVFPCETLHENMPNRIGSTTSAKKRSKILNSDSNKTLKTSQDFSLLKQMIRLQAPTPTPIHPRAISFKPASKVGANDGKNEEDRVRRDRFRKPRLFQLIEHNTIYDSSDHISISSRYQKRSRSNGRKRARHDVIAKKYRCPWGEDLSGVLPIEQIQADEMILKFTKIEKKTNGDAISCSFRISHGQSSNNKKIVATDVLNMLRVASRGKFLSRSRTNNDMNEIEFSAWFQKDQWFSLPCFLVNCFEVSLWESFDQSKLNAKEKIQVQTHPLYNTICTFTDTLNEKALFNATRLALLQVCNLEESALIRDHILWNLFCSSRNRKHYLDLVKGSSKPGKSDDNQNVAQMIVSSILNISLIDVGSSLDIFTTIVQKHLQVILAKTAEEQLLHNFSLVQSNKNTGLEKTKKKKKKNRSKSKKTKNSATKIVPSQTSSSVKSASIESDDEEEEDGRAIPDMNPKRSLPQNPISTERNKHTIIALTIVEDILDKVWRQVGLSSSKTRCDSTDKLLITENQNFTLISKERTHKNVIETSSPENKVHKITLDNMSSKKDELRKKNLSIEKDKQPKMQDKSKHLVTKPKENQFIIKSDQKKLIDEGLPPFVPFGSEQNSSDVSQSNFHSNEHQQQPPVGSSNNDPHTNFSGQHPDVFFHNYFDALTLKASGAFDGWLGVKKLQSKSSSFAELFADMKNRNENHIASSTAASLASSSGDDCGNDLEIDEKMEPKHVDSSDDCEEDEIDIQKTPCTQQITGIIDNTSNSESVDKSKCSSKSSAGCSQKNDGFTEGENSFSANIHDDKPFSATQEENFSPSLPTPFFISLADLPKLRKRANSVDRKILIDNNFTERGSPTAGSLPSSPKTPKVAKMKWSPDDIRIQSLPNPQKISSSKDSLNRGKSRAKRKSFLQAASFSTNDLSRYEDETNLGTSHRGCRRGNVSTHSISNADLQVNTFALSDDASEQFFGDNASSHKEIDNTATAKDGTTTISSSGAPFTEDINLVREERNAFRDMCLTLGAEVAKLKNLLSSERSSGSHPIMKYPTSPAATYGFNGSYDPEYMPPYTFVTKTAMSDAGVLRHDHDSTRSEDGTDLIQIPVGGTEKTWVGHHIVRGNSIGTGTHIGSDSSLNAYGFRSPHKDSFWSTPFHGLQSRLSKDIFNFLQNISIRLNRQDRKRSSAIDRLSKVVTALWPRAQVKIYGSHISNLSLPSSDIDFVICLPAVHKNAPATAAGVLEGRNAINETWQKLLARKLKGESWIEARSITLIERTVIPVIKVVTKDSKAHRLRLDISFDGPDHHGLDAAQMVTEVLQEFPLVRPLLLVLKQFLLDRGLLTAYTGGLSSYCLFLMVTRYLQEQSSSIGDCGSLLMGFLDFYGNCFDPGVTGISVLRRQYFSRQNTEQMAQIEQNQDEANHYSFPTGDAARGNLVERGMDDGASCRSSGKISVKSSPSKFALKPPRIQNRSTSTLHTLHKTNQQNHPPRVEQTGRPFSFDPLFVEDPLTSTNNVGRNAFRINQVQRAFSDAHRAILASLEWDINSSDLHGTSDYPLLNCLLQSREAFYEIEERAF